MIDVIGSLAIGLVWGWLVGIKLIQTKSPTKYPLICAATLIIIVFFHFLASLLAVFGFLLTFSIDCIVYIFYIQTLKNLYGGENA